MSFLTGPRSTELPQVKFLPHPPEPPPRHGRLIADILELLRGERLTRTSCGTGDRVLGDPHVDPS